MKEIQQFGGKGKKKINKGKKKKRKENEEKASKGGKNKKERRKSRAWRRGERKKKKKERHFPSLSQANRRLKLVRAKGKGGLHDKGYAWVPKSEFFVEVPKGRGFSYTSYFLPSGYVRAILVLL